MGWVINPGGTFSDAPEIPVNAAMIHAADALIHRAGYGHAPEDLLCRIYRGMAALAPTTITVVTEDVLGQRNAAWERLAFLEAECKRLADGPPAQHPPEFVAKVLMDREGRTDRMALARLTEVIRCARLDGRKQARDEAHAAAEMIDRLTDSNCSLAATNERLRDENAALTSEKNALADRLTPFLASQVETKPKPLVHDPFRDFTGDPRRVIR